MVWVERELDPEGGEAVLTALQAMVDSELRAGGGRDLRTPAQRRATPCASWPHRYLDSSERPTVGGERPHVTVTVDVQTLRNGHTTGPTGGRPPCTTWCCCAVPITDWCTRGDFACSWSTAGRCSDGPMAR